MTKIVVVGGTGLIGSKVVADLAEQGLEAVPASPHSGVNALTGEGLADALKDAQVVVDVSNSPSFEKKAVMDFFTTSTTRLLAEAKAAGVGHYVALSVVGTDRLPESPYFQAKTAQERLIAASGLAYSIVRATQFFEFVDGIADSATVDGTVRLPPALIQPIASDDVARAVSRAAVGDPVNGITEVAGPEPFGMDELIRTDLTLKGDPREVVTTPEAGYFGTPLKERSLLPGDGALLSETRFEDWLRASERA
ncbi:SDR family oxidoreductase [Streptomyces sp. NPDC002018]|uniref:SDR family oxidoreductase n=1 Tax=Streptomyces sp. NPDC002018 TaxID=3364629 RepID=UPI00367B482F